MASRRGPPQPWANAATRASEGDTTDEHVYARALEDKRVLVSCDLDFANAVRFPPGSQLGIVVLRAPNTWGAHRAGDEALEEIGTDISEAIAIVEADQVRIFRGNVS